MSLMGQPRRNQLHNLYSALGYRWDQYTSEHEGDEDDGEHLLCFWWRVARKGGR